MKGKIFNWGNSAVIGKVISSCSPYLKKVWVFIKYLLVFPIVFELLKDISSAVKKLRVTVIDFREVALMNLFNNHFRPIYEMMENLQNRPTHNTTFYFNEQGVAYNLNAEAWTLEMDNKQEEMVDGVVRVYFRYGHKIVDKFSLDLKKVNDSFTDKGILLFALDKMREQKIEYEKLRHLMLAGFVDGLVTNSKLFHENVTNLIVSSFVEYVRNDYNAWKKEQDELKKKAEPENADKKEGLTSHLNGLTKGNSEAISAKPMSMDNSIGKNRMLPGTEKSVILGKDGRPIVGTNAEQCCERDDDNDGNCYIHPDPEAK